MDKISFYVINFKNAERKNKMIERFKQFNINPIFTPEVELSDHRIDSIQISVESKRIWSIMLQHLDAIRHFYESDSKYCIVCEDDIHIIKNFSSVLEEVIPKFEEHKLDILCLGYLLSYKLDMSSWTHTRYYPIFDKFSNFTLHRFPDDMWGTQMYLISREYAKILLEKFTVNFAVENIKTQNFSPDWVITKNGNRAMIYPMIAVEEGTTPTSDNQQQYFHKLCHEINYDSNVFL